jgi:hypothetical protein
MNKRINDLAAEGNLNSWIHVVNGVVYCQLVDANNDEILIECGGVNVADCLFNLSLKIRGN